MLQGSYMSVLTNSIGASTILYSGIAPFRIKRNS